ncbi:MAG TPA: hypothetical protein VFI95_13760 [Terriglobales bacterium]|nr:hypothetical protein [Terriglobales bacterium]
MMITVTLIVFGILALVFFIVSAPGRRIPATQISDFEQSANAVDLAAFRNLMDPGEEEYLRQNLVPREFRKIQRERMRAALDYVGCVLANAGLLMRLGDAARQSSNPEIAQAGEQLVNQALRVRLYALSLTLKLYVAVLAPGLRVSPRAISDGYEELAGSLTRLGRLQNTRAPIVIS